MNILMNSACPPIMWIFAITFGEYHCMDIPSNICATTHFNTGWDVRVNVPHIMCGHSHQKMWRTRDIYNETNTLNYVL